MDNIDIINKSSKVNNKLDKEDDKLKELDEKLILEILYEEDFGFDAEEEDNIVDEIIELSEKSGNSIDFDAQEMFKTFNENYRSRAAEEQNENTEEEIIKKVIKEEQKNKLKRKVKKKINSKMFKMFATFAAGIAIFFVGVFSVGVTTAIASPDVFDMWVSFTEEVFDINYIRKGQPIIEEGAEVEGGKRYFKSYDSVEKKYKTSFKKPAYLPKGYKLEDIYVVSDKDNLKMNYLFASYSDGEKNLKYSVEVIDNNSSRTIEKNKEAVKLVMINNTSFYIFENNNWLVAAWQEMGMTYSISADISYDEMLKILNSLKY